MPTAAQREHATKDADIDAFFALSRPWLYGSAVVALAAFLGVAAAVMVVPGEATVPAIAGALGLITATVSVLRRKPAGRGALWVLAGRRIKRLAPVHTMWIWGALTLAMTSLALYLAFAARIP